MMFASCGKKSSEQFRPDPQVLPLSPIVPLEIGMKAPDFKLPGVDGRWYNLSDFKEEILVVVFLSNHCPYAQVYEERLIRFAQEYSKKGVDLVAISPNSPLSTPDDVMGYSDLDDTYEAIQIRSNDRAFNFPYLYDGDNQQVSIQFGLKSIPEAFVFNRDRELQYRGRIDVTPIWKAADAEDLRLVVDAVKRDGEIIRRVRDSQGCKVYWSWDQVEKDALSEAWNLAPVNLKLIDLDSMKTILVNFSEKLRMINFWATWCGPCKQEFPEFLRMKRMYRHRPVEFISVSLDDPDHYQEALVFLQQLHAPGLNYILTEEDKDLIRTKVYDQWDGSLPFTILVEPLGSTYKVWLGPFNPLEVRQAIVEHRLLGRFLRY